MGIGVIVHGYIEFFGWHDQQPSKRVYRHNRAVINSLPYDDVDWPFFTRSMFTLLPLRPYRMKIPQYEAVLITFGGAYKNMYLLEVDWIRKFERLLSQLCWDKACVYCWGSRKYTWRPEEDAYMADPPRPPKTWSLQCEALKEEEIPFSDAIDGNYVPYFKRPDIVL